VFRTRGEWVNSEWYRESEEELQGGGGGLKNVEGCKQKKDKCVGAYLIREILERVHLGKGGKKGGMGKTGVQNNGRGFQKSGEMGLIDAEWAVWYLGLLPVSGWITPPPLSPKNCKHQGGCNRENRFPMGCLAQPNPPLKDHSKNKKEDQQQTLSVGNGPKRVNFDT